MSRSFGLCLHLQGEGHSEDGSIKVLQRLVGILPQHYTASQPKSRLESYLKFTFGMRKRVGGGFIV